MTMDESDDENVLYRLATPPNSIPPSPLLNLISLRRSKRLNKN